MQNSSRISRKTWNDFLTNAALILVVFFALLPIVTTVIVSFKQQQDITRKPPVLFPCDTPLQAFDPTACRWSVEGYERVFAPKPSESSPLGFAVTGKLLRRYLPNTILYATVSALFVVVFASFAGYAFSRYRFRGHRLLMTAILAITGIPLLTNLLGLYQMGVTLRKLPIPFYDDRIFIILVYMGFYLPLSVWIAKGFFDAIPRELEDAALIDGCTQMGVLTRVTMPIALPGMLAIFLLTFVNVWNEFIAGYLLIPNNELKPAMFGLYEFLGQNIINLQVIAAACIIIAIPMVILFLFTRRSFFRAMVEGGVKG